MIVEDNPVDEALLMRQLKKAGLHEHVRAIHNGKKALSYLTTKVEISENLAAIFLDLNLPGLSGLQLLESIRRNDRISDIPVIVMTSSNSPDELDRCKVLGVANYVQKPLTFSSFAKAFADTFHARPISKLAEESFSEARLDVRVGQPSCESDKGFRYLFRSHPAEAGFIRPQQEGKRGGFSVRKMRGLQGYFQPMIRPFIGHG